MLKLQVSIYLICFKVQKWMSSVWKLHKHYQYRVQCNIFLVNKQQMSKASAQFSSKNIFKFLYTCSSSKHEGNFQGLKDWKFWHTIFFECLVCWDFWYMCAPPQWRNMYLVILFSKTPNQIMYLNWVLANCKTCQFASFRRDI